jgi:hypothetical protein
MAHAKLLYLVTILRQPRVTLQSDKKTNVGKTGRYEKVTAMLLVERATPLLDKEYEHTFIDVGQKHA